VLLLSGLLAACSSNDDRTGVSLILKTQTNPYFVSMKKAALEQADKSDVHLSVAAGTADGDTQNQINEIYTAIARGDKGILITSNGNAVNAALRQAKEAGLFVSALDTPLAPADTADITFATDNREAGRLIGRYAAARLNGKPAVIAMLDLYNDQVVSVDTNRDQGFLEGMGIKLGNKRQNGLEPRKGKYTGGKGGS
jgi:fructose transport system substrate-binding protein